MVVAIDAAASSAAGTAWAPLLNVMTMLVELGAIAGLSSVMVVHDAGAAAHLLRDGQRRLLPRWAAHDPSALPHAAHHHDHHRRRRGAGRRASRRSASLGELVSIGTLLAFVIVSIGVIVLRRTASRLPRPFRMPCVPFVSDRCRRSSALALDGRPARGHLGAADHLDGDRHRHLLRSTGISTAAWRATTAAPACRA